MAAASVTITIRVPRIRPLGGVCIDPEQLAAILTQRAGASRNRLDSIARNVPPLLRARGFPDLAASIERSVGDVIGVTGDESRPGALGRMLAEVAALLTAAEDC